MCVWGLHPVCLEGITSVVSLLCDYSLQLSRFYFFNFVSLCWALGCCEGLSLVAGSGVPLHGDAQASPCRGLSRCRAGSGAQSLRLPARSPGSVVVGHGLSCSAVCGISPTRGQTCVSCIGSMMLCYWSTGKAPALLLERCLVFWLSQVILTLSILHVQNTTEIRFLKNLYWNIELFMTDCRWFYSKGSLFLLWFHVLVQETMDGLFNVIRIFMTLKGQGVSGAVWLLALFPPSLFSPEIILASWEVRYRCM